MVVLEVPDIKPSLEERFEVASKERVEAVLKELSLDEQVALVSGISMWESGGIPRLGIAPLRLTDGPHGARGLSLHGDSGALLAPCELAMAATFDERLITEVGALLGAECRRRGADVLLGPCLNLQRFPVSGRHFECFSEDPYLASRAGVAYVRGVQRHAVACLKHFVCNDQETDRGTVNAVVDSRTLREVYLAPFEAAVKEADAGSIMCGYNRLNGAYCTENHWLLQEVLRDEWGFKGAVMSDWFGNQSTEPSMQAGLNIEMPGLEPRHYGGYLANAVRRGRVPLSLLEERCRPVLRLLLAPGRGVATDVLSTASVADEQLLCRAAAEACVLLRNERSALPLDLTRLSRVAVIGPNAANTVVQGGGSSRVHPARCETILEALQRELVSKGVELEHAAGCSWEELPSAARTLEVSGLQSMGSCDACGQPSSSYGFLKSAKVNDCFLSIGAWICRKEWFRVGLMPVLRACGWRLTTPEEAARGSNNHRPRVDAVVAHSASEEAMITAAVAVASKADACILVLGTHGFWELEGLDQPHMRLLGHQDELVVRVAAAAKGPVIVVLNVGSPKELSWLSQVDAVVLAHFGGQGMAAGVLSVLLGKTCPSGRLPTTWPIRLDRAPAVIATSGLSTRPVHGEVHYAEGLLLGYRATACNGNKADELFAFGYGLSYTSFAYSAFRAEQTVPCGSPGGPQAVAKLIVRNTGPCGGAEVAQLYAEAEHSPRSLRGFRRTAVLSPDGEELLTFELGPRELGAWFDPTGSCWQLPAAGARVGLTVGSSSVDARATAELVLQ